MVARQRSGRPRSPDVSGPDVRSLTALNEEEVEHTGYQVAVSIVSSSRLWYEGLATLLNAYMHIVIVGSYAGSLSSLITTVHGYEHVVLLDAGLGQEQGRAWLRQCRRLLPAAHPVVLEVPDDGESIGVYLAAGADGYLWKGASMTHLIDVIDHVRQGTLQLPLGVPASVGAARTHGGERRHSMLSPVSPLTPREAEVLSYIARDYSNQAIATALVIALPTVKNHVHNLLEKLHVQYRREAARLAVEQGWLDWSPDPTERA